MRRFLCTLALSAAAVGFPLGIDLPNAPLSTHSIAGMRVTLSAACAQDGPESDEPSCRPKPGVDCVHGEIIRKDKCDPDKPGCPVEED